MPTESPVRTPLASAAGFAFGTAVSAAIAIFLFILHVDNREPAWLDALSDPFLFALIGLIGGTLMFRSIAAGSRFALAFIFYPWLARGLYQAGRAIPYDGATLDMVTSFYFTLLMPAIATGIVGAVAIGLLLRSSRYVLAGFAAFAIAGAVGGAAAPLISTALSRIAAESAWAATLAIYGEELVRFFVAGYGLAWILRGDLSA
ncbi:MAG TPA: hypothetical protein VMT61_05325 [Candidatus Binataceae bacterium]|nr:hypothetical protein [Candidatus Binataceae bacterium]